jgi:ketosteroid isomerase-like protein
VSENDDVMEALARQVRTVLNGGDLASYRALLDPDVSWGAPGARQPSCRNRDQVLSWYEKGREAGMRAQVSDVSILGDRLLVSLTVGGTEAAQQRGGAALRWQVLTVRHGRIIDIVGFDDRQDALAHAGTPAS